MARVAAELPLVLAGLELDLDDGGTLLVRLLGGEEEVAAGTARARERLGPPADQVEGSASAELHRGRSAWEGRDRLVVRISALPGLLAETAGTARALAREIEGGVSCHVSQGVARVAADLPEGGVTDAVVELIEAARTRIGMHGGSLLVSSAPGVDPAAIPWTGGPGREDVLAGRIKALFDPSGVLAPRIPRT